MPEDKGSTGAMDAYLGRLRALFIAVKETVPAEQLTQAHSWIEHGEPAEGMLYLAWAITSGDHRVPRWVVDGIRESTAALVPPEQLPADLYEHIG
jgi:hypothetical protein